MMTGNIVKLDPVIVEVVEDGQALLVTSSVVRLGLSRPENMDK